MQAALEFRMAVPPPPPPLLEFFLCKILTILVHVMQLKFCCLSFAAKFYNFDTCVTLVCYTCSRSAQENVNHLNPDMPLI